MAEAARLYGTPPQGGEAFLLRADDGIELRAACWPLAGARGGAVLFNGRTEYVEKTYRIVEGLRARGFSCATLDWRGQGLSERLLSDRRRGYVGHFDEYRCDAEALFAALDARGFPARRLLFGHSMGGSIAARMAQQGPERFEAVIFSAPMFDLALPYATKVMGRAVASAGNRAGYWRRYAMGNDRRVHVGLGFEANVLTRDRAIFDETLAVLAEAPDLGLGGVTWGWLDAAFAEMEAVTDPEAPRMRAPTLILMGEADLVVSMRAIEEFVEREPMAALVRLPGAYHEPFLDLPETRAACWAAVDAFLARAWSA